MEKEPIKSHEDLEVYKMAFNAAMKIFELSKEFPVEERYSLTNQMRRSSRSVCANLAEAWRIAVKCDYLNVEASRELYGTYNQVLGILVTIINNPSPLLPAPCFLFKVQ
jgi:hypothetical protein